MKKQIGGLLMLGVAMCFAAGCATTTVIHEPTKETVILGEPKVIFTDSFSPTAIDQRNLWQNNGKGTWMVQGPISSLQGCEDGCLSQNSEDPRALNAIEYVMTPGISDGAIETNLRYNYELSVAETPERLSNLKSFTGAGIVFRMVDVNNYYMFRLAGEEGAVLGKMVNGNWTDLGNPRRVDFMDGGKIRPKSWYKLKVIARGNNIQAFVNDNPIISTTDSTFTVGKFGLTTFKTVADFENIKVTE
jgi:hypothetical protein